MLTRDEFLDLFFEDLELPDLVKNQIVATETMAPVRAGIAVDGSPSQIDMGRTMRQSMARRIGLRRPKPPEVRALEAEVFALEQSGRDPAHWPCCRPSWTWRCGACAGAVDRPGGSALPPLHA